MEGYLIFTYGLFTLNSLSCLWKREVQEIDAYLKKNASLERIFDRQKKEPKQLVSGKIKHY